LAVVVPAALFARGLMSRFSSMNAATAGFGFFVWEAVKIAVTVGMLVAAPQLLPGLDWLAMLIGLVVTLKVYWLALLMRPKRITD
jgi:ATP synthase protein I